MNIEKNLVLKRYFLPLLTHNIFKFLSGVFQKYTNEFFVHRKDAKAAEKMVFCSGGEEPPEQKPPPL